VNLFLLGANQCIVFLNRPIFFPVQEIDFFFWKNNLFKYNFWNGMKVSDDEKNIIQKLFLAYICHFNL